MTTTAIGSRITPDCGFRQAAVSLGSSLERQNVCVCVRACVCVCACVEAGQEVLIMYSSIRASANSVLEAEKIRAKTQAKSGQGEFGG